MSPILPEERQRLMMWITRCGAIAGSASYQVNGNPGLQVKMLANQLRAAAADGIDWRTIYAPLYEEWHARRPLFPDVTMMLATSNSLQKLASYPYNPT